MRAIVLAAIGGLGLACLVQNASADPWAYANVGARNLRLVLILATLPKNEGRFRCYYVWSMIFANHKKSSDHCETEVPNGIRDKAVCTRRYPVPVVTIQLTQATCSPEE